MERIKLILKTLYRYRYPTILVLVVLIIIAIPWMIKQDLFYCAPIHHELFGTYGDFVGGVIGTIFAVIAVYYAVKTYIKDKKNAKLERRRLYQEQQNNEKNIQKERIRNHFYTMLTKHNENSSGLKNEEIDYFYKNIKLIQSIFEFCIKNLKTKITKSDAFNLSYFYFFYGSNLAPNSIPNKQASIEEMNKHFNNNNIQFEGVSKNLGVYFRQLFQIVTYINDQNLLTYREKYSYIKSLRATLSNEEQYLLFLNSLSILGEVWEQKTSIIDKNKKLVTKYNLIKNIPKNFPRLLGDKDFENKYSKIHYEYEESDENKKRERDEWERDYV